VLALLVIAAGCAAFAQQFEPIKLRGAYIGQPISDYADCASGKGKSLREGYKLHGKPCTGLGSVFRTKMKHFMSSTMEGDGFAFENGKLFSITIYIPNEDWDKVRYDLTEKLGPPAKEVPQLYQNGFGARWEYEQGFWQKENLVAFAKIKVANIGGVAITHVPETEGIEVTITHAQRETARSSAEHNRLATLRDPDRVSCARAIMTPRCKAVCKSAPAMHGYRQRKSTRARGCQWAEMMKTYNAAHPHARLINPKTGIDVTARTA